MKRLLPAVLLATACTAKPSDGKPAPDAGFPAVRVGGTAATDTVANAPARCGQPAHTWLRTDTLGKITARGDVTDYSADYLQGLVTSANLPIPRPPSYDSRVATITYLTQDRGVTIEATGLMGWPYGIPVGHGPVPIMLVLHGTQGFTDGCSLDTSPETKLLIAYFTSLGYLTVAPDYLGLKAHAPPTGFLHPYLVGQATAIASLDMVRAAGHFNRADYDDVEVANRVMVFGASQGGHAALWVDRLAPYYAPELNLVGGVAMVPPMDLLGEETRALRTLVPATGNTIAMLGATSDWYGLRSRLGEIFKPPYDTTVVAALAANCNPSDAVPSGATTADLFTPLLPDAAQAGTLGSVMPWGCISNENGLTTTSIPRINQDSPSYGILTGWGSADTLVDTATERPAFSSLCNAGVPLQFLECTGASHTRTTVWALPEIVKFMDDRLAGVAFTRDCTVAPAVRCQGTPTP